MGIKVGIDLGTTFCAVAKIDERTGKPVIIPNTQGEKITPSVIQFLENGEISVGSDAREAFEAGESGCTSAFKRNMGRTDTYCTFYGKNYTSEDLSAILLRYLKEETEAVTGQTIDEAVVTVPAYFYDKERGATMRAARRAGLKIRQIINEPTAAAMNYGMNHWRENAIVMVYDLGGGTFDVTLVQMKENNQMKSLRTTGNHILGGKNWDECICMLMENKIEEGTGKSIEEYPEIHQMAVRKAENVKKQLTNKEIVSVSFNVPDYGSFSLTVDRKEFDDVTKNLLVRTVTLCENLLKELNIEWKDITDILLVGGSTRMRQVSEYLEKCSGHKPLMQVNPDEAVALGAAIQVHLPLPEYTVISMVSSKEEEPDPGKGVFNFTKNKKGSKRPVPSPTPVNFTLPGKVGPEKALVNVLSIGVSDVVAHALGAIAVNEEHTRYIDKIIIPSNQKIPVKCAEAFKFWTSPNKDNEVDIYMIQGEQGSKKLSECNIIGKYVVTGIKHDRNENPTIIRIQYSYDVNGMIHVQARQGSGTTDLPIREEPVPKDMTEYDNPPKVEKSQAQGPVSAVLAIDVSGSMSGDPIKEARRAMKKFIDQFDSYGDDIDIGLIAVSDRSEIVQELTTDLGKCRSSVDSIRECMTGICNAGHPFNDILQMLEYVKGRRIGIVLADGQWEHQNRAIEAAKQCHKNGIEIVGIGFGYADKAFLKEISSGDIQSVFVKQEELTASFGRIAQAISSGQTGTGGRQGRSSATETWRAINE